MSSGNLTYDGNGNLTGKNPTARPDGQVFVYDAWNRLVHHNLLGQVAGFDKHTLFSYDALGRRIVEGPTYTGTQIPSNVLGKDLYYSDRWQVIHEINWVESGGGSSANGDENMRGTAGGGGGDGPREGTGGGVDGGGSFFAQQTDYVWSLAYIDAMVLRDRDLDLNGSLEERIYVQQDANFNVTALTNASGVVQERFIYDPYGSATYLNPD